MSSPIEARKYSVELAVRERTFKYRAIFFTGILSFLIPIVNILYFRWVLIQELESVLIIFFFGLILISFQYAFDASKKEEKSFLQIFEAYEISERAINDPNLWKLVYNKFIKALKNMESIDLGNAPWHSKLVNDENDFINTLRDRVAPAILEGKIDPNVFHSLANLFLNTDTIGMDALNNSYKIRFEERELPKSEYIMYINNIYKTKMGKIITSIAVGYVMIFAISFIYAHLIGQLYSEFLAANPPIILLGGAALAGALITALFKE